MMIDEITTERVQARCPGCSSLREIQVSSLVLGTTYMLDAIELPPCACGALTLLVRTWDEHPADQRGTQHDRQRRAINALAQHLRGTGRSHPDRAKQHAAETSAPPDLGELVHVAK